MLSCRRLSFDSKASSNPLGSCNRKGRQPQILSVSSPAPLPFLSRPDAVTFLPFECGTSSCCLEQSVREDTQDTVRTPFGSFLIQDLKKTQGCLLSYQPVISFRVSLALYFFHLLAGTHFALQLPILIPCLFSPNSLLPPEMGMFQAAAELQAIWFPYPHSSAPCHRRHSGRAVSHTPLPVTM